MLSKFFASMGGIGYAPRFPGTFGSAAGLFLVYVTGDSFGLRAGILIVLLGLGFIVCGRAERSFGKKDSSAIVIDEAAGMVLTMMFVPVTAASMAIGFFLFRALDIIKPFPCARAEHLKGSAGVMMDDIIAGLYANSLTQAVTLFTHATRQ